MAKGLYESLLAVPVSSSKGVTIMQCYKMTDSRGQTYQATQWGEGITHETSGEGELCGPGWLHFYSDPLLAVLLDPIYGRFQNPQLWKAEASGSIKNYYGLKSGCTKLTTLQIIDVPQITMSQRIRFAILCVKRVYSNDAWNQWASNWLNESDRTKKSALIAKSHTSMACAKWAATAAAAAAASSAAAIKWAVWAAASSAAAAVSAASEMQSYSGCATAMNLIAIAKQACQE